MRRIVLVLCALALAVASPVLAQEAVSITPPAPIEVMPEPPLATGPVPVTGVPSQDPPPLQAMPEEFPQALPGPALAPSYVMVVPPGFQRHDGFFLRLSGGIGYGMATTTSKGKDYSIHGLGGIMDLAVGYSVIENLAITFDFFGGVQMNPTFSVDDKSSSGWDTNLDSIGFGLGATWHFMPLNIYVNAGIGAATMVLEVYERDFESRTGFGVHAGVGKEWWVSADWGLGLAGQFFYMRVPDQDSTWDDLGFGLSFSATYN